MAAKRPLDPLLMCILDCVQPFNCVGLWLVVNQLMVAVAKENQILVAIPLRARERMVSTRARRALGHDVRHLTEYHRAISRAGLCDKEKSALRKGTSLT
jgi:hypothetical protein